ETNTDDSDGEVVETCEARPDRNAIEALLRRFTGEILQVPPCFSAIKIAGERAYDLAREGEAVELQPRRVTIHRLTIVEHLGDETKLEMDCGKGAYVRAIARDLGRLLGCFGHVSALRRSRKAAARRFVAPARARCADWRRRLRRLRRHADRFRRGHRGRSRTFARVQSALLTAKVLAALGRAFAPYRFVRVNFSDEAKNGLF